MTKNHVFCVTQRVSNCAMLKPRRYLVVLSVKYCSYAGAREIKKLLSKCKTFLACIETPCTLNTRHVIRALSIAHYATLGIAR